MPANITPEQHGDPAAVTAAHAGHSAVLHADHLRVLAASQEPGQSGPGDGVPAPTRSVVLGGGRAV